MQVLPCENDDEDTDRQSPDYFKKMYDRVSALGKIGVWECELASEALTWTDAVYDMFELPRQSKLDRASTLERYEPNCRRELEKLRAEAIEHCSGFTVDVSLRSREGEIRWIRITGDVEQDNGRAVRIFGTKQDITREKLAQQTILALQSELIHASRLSAVEAMRSTLAHDLNQPLAALALYVAALRNLLSNLDLGQAGLAALDGIESCALKAGQIMRDMRNMPKQEELTSDEFNVDTAVREACAIALKGREQAIDLHYSGGPGFTAVGDRVQIQQVVINLIRNASEALSGRERRDIHVTVKKSDRNGFVEVAVCDTGPGIAEEVAETLFDSFVSTDHTKTGIGLAISRTIVEAHSGKLTAENRPGGGAAISFTIPTAANCREG